DGEIVTASMLNTEIHDAVLELQGRPANRCSAYHTATQSVGVSNTDALNLGAEDYDTSGMHSTVTNNNRITIPSGGNGDYLIQGVSQVLTSAESVATLHLRKNGTTIRSAVRTPEPTAALQLATVVVSAWVSLVAGDYIDLAGQSGSGGTTT